jgi:hypothetical protein
MPASKQSEALTKFQEMMQNAGYSPDEAFEQSTKLNEKFSRIILDAALKSTQVAADWSEETIQQLGDLNRAKADPAQMSKDMSDYAKVQAETTMEKMAVFAELAQSVQSETVSLFTEAGREMFEAAMNVQSTDKTAGKKKK